MSRPKTIEHDIGFDALAVLPQISTAHELTGVLGVRNDMGFKGRAIRVGVIGMQSESGSPVDGITKRMMKLTMIH